jgi:hypothetical protein
VRHSDDDDCGVQTEPAGDERREKAGDAEAGDRRGPSREDRD